MKLTPREPIKRIRIGEEIDAEGVSRPSGMPRLERDPEYWSTKAKTDLLEGSAKRKILIYLNSTGARNLDNMVFSKFEETARRFALLITNPQDPAGEGKFDDWTSEEVATLAHFLFPFTFGLPHK